MINWTGLTFLVRILISNSVLLYNLYPICGKFLWTWDLNTLLKNNLFNRFFFSFFQFFSLPYFISSIFRLFWLFSIWWNTKRNYIIFHMSTTRIIPTTSIYMHINPLFSHSFKIYPKILIRLQNFRTNDRIPAWI